MFILTRHAVPAWSLIILLLMVNALAASAYAAGDLQKKQIIPLFIVLLLLIPLVTAGALALYSFFTFPKGM